MFAVRLMGIAKTGPILHFHILRMRLQQYSRIHASDFAMRTISNYNDSCIFKFIEFTYVIVVIHLLFLIEMASFSFTDPIAIIIVTNVVVFNIQFSQGSRVPECCSIFMQAFMHTVS